MTGIVVLTARSIKYFKPVSILMTLLVSAAKAKLSLAQDEGQVNGQLVSSTLSGTVLTVLGPNKT